MVPSLWNMLSDEARERLRRFQWEHYHVVPNPPGEAVQLIIVSGKVEPLEEIDHIMRQPPRRPRK